MTDFEKLPAPLTPPDCDLRDFAFMPLDVLRLRDSDLAVKADGEAFRCAVLLWCASWHQVPAASLPDDDDVLAQLAGFGRVTKEWLRHRDGALRGWVKCTDGRLYHPVVAEKAVEAWRAKMVQRWKTECARIKKHNQRHETDLPVPDLDEWLSLGCPQGQPIGVLGTKKNVPRDGGGSPSGHPPVVPRETHSKGQGEGQGQGQYLKEKEAAAASIAGAPAQGHDPAPPPLDADKTPEERAMAVAVWLRRREQARGKQPRGTQSNDPRIAAWIAAKATGLQLAEAYDLAVLDREATGDAGPITPGFLDIFVVKVLNPPQAKSAVNGTRPAVSKSDPLAWLTTASGLEAKGAELGIVQAQGEPFPSFKARVIAAAGLSEDDKARARADLGVHI
ncbi:DUF1376 domain-containing protein [Achromobacter sp.]|uniref:DUF1376 domain-containing protein n=1 Tax=Achromobacter sp. TaxID=134375 RepID=UPI000ED62D2E|nr:DUF1376 domain-containing protein [Achromobacter sp.]HCW18988.1 DUF1376 domain-containing protein [Achromobacter sp.]